MRWFGWFRKSEFTLPKTQHMSLDSMFRYWRRLPSKYRAECEWYLYRMDPAKAPGPSVLKFRTTEEQAAQDQKAFGRVPPDADSMRYLAVDKLSLFPGWWQSRDEPDAERRVYFLARIIRRWRVMGADRHAEICVASFDLLPEACPKLASVRRGNI
jgi:hypothetical protein